MKDRRSGEGGGLGCVASLSVEYRSLSAERRGVYEAQAHAARAAVALGGCSAKPLGLKSRDIASAKRRRLLDSAAEAARGPLVDDVIGTSAALRAADSVHGDAPAGADAVQWAAAVARKHLSLGKRAEAGEEKRELQVLGEWIGARCDKKRDSLLEQLPALTTRRAEMPAAPLGAAELEVELRPDMHVLERFEAAVNTCMEELHARSCCGIGSDCICQ